MLQRIASKSDVVIECADADHIRSNQALLAGLKQRHEKKGTTPILIHTSGTGVLADNAGGMYGSDTIYYDSDSDQIERLEPGRPHRNVDLNVVAADREGYVKTYIILPSTVYGLASGPLVDVGVMNPQSQQIPVLVRTSLDRQQAGMVGRGYNYHPNVHIDEAADLYRVIMEASLSGQDIGHGREGYYFAENGEHTMYEIAERMGEELYCMRLAKTATPSPFTKEELQRYFQGSDNLGTNVRCRAERSRAIGWKPWRRTRDMLDSIKPEIDYILAGRKLT
ncbi:hypothetical protein L226DRAFT_58443 [Lentinus tigrinus ALCF2SS1-7]|nr:hypothetical protein L226DRAFT_58443 [Lentinus tigrinus ALCF2SS1-7]